MTKVMCGYVMCIYNKSTTAQQPGMCMKDKINLKYTNTTVEDKEEKYDKEMLDCTDFVWDNGKMLVGVEKNKM